MHELRRATPKCKIQDMQPGDSGWTVPWGMFADAENKLWLNGSYTLCQQPFGTADMRVWRDATDGLWRVDARQSQGSIGISARLPLWSRSGGGYVGRFQAIPVAEAKF